MSNLQEILEEQEIIYLGLLPAKIFTFIASSDSTITLLEAKEYAIFLLKFYNYYKGSCITEAIEYVDNKNNKELENITEQIDKNSTKYFTEVYKISQKLPVDEKDIIDYLVKELAFSVAKASAQYYGVGAEISAAEHLSIKELLGIFKLKS